MKRCLECRRDYYDDSLLYCLDDGSALLEGPASGDEPQTALLSDIPSEAPTKEFEPASKNRDRKISSRNSVIAGVIGIILVTALGIGSYLYYGRRGARQIDSIAVMPFVNESGNADFEYLADGMTETLIANLTQIPKLNVKARSSVFRYKGRETDAKLIGKELGVQAILNGRVVQRGQDLIFYVELVDSQTENSLWKQSYNKSMANLVALQTEIARDVADRLKIRLSGADEQNLAKNYTENAEAYQLYLKGRFHWNKRTKNDIYRSIEYYQQAVNLDPDYAIAYSGLADAYSILGGYDYSVPRRELAAKARENATKALSLDDSLSQAHVSAGMIFMGVDHDFVRAERELLRAIELNPNNAAGYHNLGLLQSGLGRMSDADANYRRALELEPASAALNRGYGAFLMYARRYDESVEQLKKTIDLDPNFVLAYLSLSNTYQMQGKYSDAVQAYVQSRKLIGKSDIAELMHRSYTKGGWKGFITDMDNGAWFEEFRPLYIRATQLASIGEKDKALALLEEAYEERDGFMHLLNVDPRLDPLRDDPRFKALVKKVGL